MSGTVARTSGAGSVGTTSAVLATQNVGRRKIVVVNTHASQTLSIELATAEGVAPTAVNLEGIVLYPQGAWSEEFWDGACAIIGSGAATTYSIAEW